MADEVYVPFYKPPGVIDFLGIGAGSFIGVADETSVLKYAKDPGDSTVLEILRLEARILETIGPHKHVIGFKGQVNGGLLLERACHGSIAQYLKDSDPSWEQRIMWARQTTEAVIITHKANVIHCDLNCNNIVLDHNLNAKLCDFQGILFWPDGSIEADGLARENTKSSMPRADSNYADRTTDLFALGSAFYYMMEGHEPFPDLDSIEDEEEIERRFSKQQFPDLKCPPMTRVIHKCWKGSYESAGAVLRDLEFNDSLPRDVV